VHKATGEFSSPQHFPIFNPPGSAHEKQLPMEMMHVNTYSLYSGFDPYLLLIEVRLGLEPGY
jgi:hypothetical protein